MKQLILFLISVVACQAATTRVLDTIQYPDGTFPTGRATITWGSFTSASSVAVAGGERIITITSGAVDIRLEPNLNAIPSSTCYTVTYNLPRGSYQECWVVPVSASAVTVSSIRTVAYPTITTSLSQIATAGLVAGDIVYYNGSAVTRLPRGSVNGQALTIDTSLSTYLKWATISGSGGGTWGSITGTLSNQTDLAAALTAKIGLASLSATSPIVYNNSTGGFTHAASAATIIPCGDTTHSCRLTFDPFGHVSAIANDAIAGVGAGITSPGTSTDRSVLTCNGTSCSAARNSNVVIDASDNISTPGTFTAGLGSTVGATASLGNSTGDTGASSLTINPGDGASNTEPGFLHGRSSHSTKRDAFLFPCTNANGAWCISGSTPVADASNVVLTTDNVKTVTNMTYDTAGSGNSFSINGLAATANTGTGAVVRATALTPLKIRTCTIGLGQQGAASPVLADDNDITLGACKNYTGVDWTVLTVGCQADAASLVVQPRLHGGSSGSILTGDLTCGNTVDTFGTVQGTAPLIHSYSGTGASTTCPSTPCSADVLITTAGGAAKSAIVTIVVSLP